MASVEQIVEAFARGLAQGFAQRAPLDARKRRRRATRSFTRESPAQRTPSPPIQAGLFDRSESLAPPFTQAQFEHMERTLRGERPIDSYTPDEGVAPWQGS